MRSHLARTTIAALASLSLAGCIDADIQTTLAADGSGTMSVRMGLTPGMVEVVTKMKELDPKDNTLDELQMIEVSEPTEEERAAMKEAGIELLDLASEASEKAISSRFKIAFKSLSGLEHMDAILADGKDNPASGMRLTKEEDGTYVLAMSGGSDDDDDPFGLEDMDEDEDEDEAGEEISAEEEARRTALAMEMMGKMMAEVANLKMVIGMEVPGEVVSFTPASLGKKDGGKVTWTLDFAAMMAASASGEEPSMEEGFTVRFRMPEGQSMPESALWSGPAKKAPESGAEGADDTE